MTRHRLLVTVAILAVLAALMVWQARRERLMTACLAGGGYWDGATTTCRERPYGPILKRALERS